MPTIVEEARVGVGVILQRPNGTILVGKRLGSHGTGEYALPGGHLEYKESFEECAIREVQEECGIDLTPFGVTFEYAVNSVFDSGAHYVTIFMRSRVDVDTVPVNTEPDKCAGWEWVPYEDIPRPVFLPLLLLIDSGYEPLMERIVFPS